MAVHTLPHCSEIWIYSQKDNRSITTAGIAHLRKVTGTNLSRGDDITDDLNIISLLNIFVTTSIGRKPFKVGYAQVSKNSFPIQGRKKTWDVRDRDGRCEAEQIIDSNAWKFDCNDLQDSLEIDSHSFPTEAVLANLRCSSVRSPSIVSLPFDFYALPQNYR